MAPIGKSLTETTQKLAVKDNLYKLIIEKFEKVMEEKFDAIPQNNVRTNSVGKHKLVADAESYNNVYQVWKFRITDFNCMLEEKEFKNIECDLVTIPHKHYQPPGVRPGKRGNK